MKSIKSGSGFIIVLPKEYINSVGIYRGMEFTHQINEDGSIILTPIFPEPPEEQEQEVYRNDAEIAAEYEALKIQEEEANRIDEEYQKFNKIQYENLQKIKEAREKLMKKMGDFSLEQI